jgi:arylsulfatase A-like enzyme
MSKISRRDFIKLAAPLLAGTIAAQKMSSLNTAALNQRKNIIIILCDAFSAMNLSLHGYPRRTTRNIDDFANFSTVYHNHYSGGNFTTTSTASMLTGMNAWTHRAINYAGLVKPEFIGINPYSLLGSEYQRFAFSQNVWPSRLVSQYMQDVDRFLPPSAYSMLKSDFPLSIFENDRALASIALEDFMLSEQGGTPAGSALLGYLNKNKVLNFNEKLHNLRYPHGFPEIMPLGHLIPYLNEELYDGVFAELETLHSGGQPFFAYFHLWSPHFPYRPRNSYTKFFDNDGYSPVSKPSHPLATGLSEEYMFSQRTWYDRQIVHVDEEFGRLLSELERRGILDNSYLIFTSDHGEMFERGFVGHGFQMMYEPVLRIPLIVHAPGQSRRDDILASTSNIDLLPTLLSLAGKDIPSEIDGRVLPGLGGVVDEDRPIFSMVAVDNSAFAPIKKAVITMRKREYKLMAYLGYDKAESEFELYNLEADPQELVDLAGRETAVLTSLKNELFDHLREANKPFTG